MSPAGFSPAQNRSLLYYNPFCADETRHNSPQKHHFSLCSRKNAGNALRAVKFCKKMRAVALGSFRIAWKRFHFSITVYYRFLILSTLFSNFFRFSSRSLTLPLRLRAIRAAARRSSPLFFARPPPFFAQAADAEAASAKAAHEEAALSLKRHAAYPLPQTLRAGRSPPPTAPYPNRTQILTKKSPFFGISVPRTTKNRAKIHEKRTFSCENILSYAWRRERDLNPRYPCEVHTISSRAP